MVSHDRPLAHDPTLLLFTESFPYGLAVEDSFLRPELPHLQKYFSRVVVVPARTVGPRARIDGKVDVDETLASALRKVDDRLRLAGSAARSGLVLRDLAMRPGIITSSGAMRMLLDMAGRGQVIREWVHAFISRSGLGPRRHVAYSFWCTHAAVGIALAKRDAPQLTAVSRAHGADLYPERHHPPYLPCRKFVYSQLDGLFPDSERGAAYVIEHHPELAGRCRPARMGTEDPGFIANGSVDGRVVVVSCSLVLPVKRVDLIARAVAGAARRRPEVTFEWRHFGVGELLPSIEQIAVAEFPANASAHFPGYPGTDGLMQFYRTNPVDLFVNASQSEGTPVSIMEAISCGIPVVATSVGGNPEIVTDENGELVGANPTPDELAEKIIALTLSSKSSPDRRLGSRHLWNRKYNATANYAEFARDLQAMWMNTSEA